MSFLPHPLPNPYQGNDGVPFKYREQKAGKELVISTIKSGKALGYEYMGLDTLTLMESENQLYKSLGFIEIDPYRDNPINGAIYMELNLKRS